MNTLNLDDRCLDQATEWLVKLQSDTLTAEQEAAFSNWLQASEEHQLAYIEVERQWAGLGAVEQLADGRYGVDAGNDRPVAVRGWPRALAASIALFLLGIFGFLYLDNGAHRYQTQVGDQLEFVLKDGTLIHLNTHSQVQVDINDARRLVRLSKGEVFFDVARDPQRPFVVETDGGVVRVYGTRFNILSGAAGSEVTVIEGVVGVAAMTRADRAAAESFEADVKLLENQQIILSGALDRDMAGAAVRQVDASSTVAWRSGKLVFNGEPLATVLEDINRYFDGEIRLGDAALEELEIVAVLQLQDKKTTLKALEATFNLASVEVSDKLTLLYLRK